MGVIDAVRRDSDSLKVKDLILLTDALLERINRESNPLQPEAQLIATLVWALGATAPEPYLEKVAKVLARSFRNPIWTEDAAAVRAGRLLYARFRGAALELMANELGGIKSDMWHKYEIAVVRPALIR